MAAPFHTIAARGALPLLVLALVAGTGCVRDSVPPDSSDAGLSPAALDPARALDEVRRFVAVGPRHSGTPGAARAAQYIAERLDAIGIEPVIDTFEDPTPQGNVVFRNVLGVLQGTQRRTIILASHYDTKAGVSDTFIGANDSGSSTGLLFELARCLKAHGPLPADIMFAFFDGEECMVEYGPRDGLHGSRHLAQTLVQNQRASLVTAVLLLDMVGDCDLTVTIPRNSDSELVSAVFAAARAEGVREHFGFSPGAIIDDHVPFRAMGMPAVNIIDLEFGSAPGRNDYWHTDQDTLKHVCAESLGSVGRVTLRTLNQLLYGTL